LRIRCARQRWRAERGKHSSIARMIPGALKERPNRLDVLLRSRHQPQKRFTSVLADPPGGQNRFSPLARTQPLGDAIDKQVGHRMFGEIALAEVFVLGPQLLGDLAYRSPRQKPPAGLVGEGVLDVARRQAPRVEFDRQSLEFPRSSRKRRPHARHEWLRRVPNLRSRIVHSALCCLDLARSITVAIAGFAGLATLVTFPSKRVADLSLERLLDDQAKRQTHKIASPGRRPQFSVQQGAKLLARTLRRG
jgi:hypothetical protein